MDRAGDFAVRLETVAEDTTVASVEGELDMATSPRLERAIDEASPGGRLVVDLTGCTFVDSSGIRVLAARAHVSDAAGGDVAIVATDPGIRRALEIAAIDTVIELHETLDAAL